MKKKSTSQSARARRTLGEGGFFNLRVLISLCIALAGICLALVGLDAFAANSAPVQVKNHIITASNDPLVPVGFDCSKIQELGIDKQENFRAGAIMIACGEADVSGSSVGGFFQRIGQAVKELLAPLYGSGDVNLINHPETSPNIVQSETYTTVNPDNPQQIVVAYNDSRGRNASPINISGASVSTDGGATFDRLTNASGQSPFAGTEGDPVILYNKPSQTWFTVWLDTGCGGQGLGGYKSTTPWDPNSWTHFCVFSEASADRESGFADNNSSSPFFGRMFISWNDFNVGGGALFATFSTDNGTTWHAPISVTSTFIRDVQITGDKITGDVYIAGMDENSGNGCSSGCGSTRNNKIFRSTDGGNTWTNTYTGPSFIGPCRGSSGFFCTMYSSPAYWRHQGWGEPAAFNHVVSYVYGAKNGSDPGDVFYIRSTDSGVTFSAPFQLNSNTDATKAQWQANLSVSEAGTLLATWYDETPRTSASCQPSNPTNLCYQMHSRKSPDNGVTWLADDVLSDVASPLPLQGDPGINPTYVGDYDYGSAVTTKHVTSWVDGRNPINGASQQDAFTDKVVAPCSSYMIGQIGGSIVPGTTDIGNHGDDTVTTIALPFPYTLYDQTFTSINLSSNGNAQFTTTDTTFTNQCLPWTTHNYTIFPYWDDLYLVNSGFGIFTSISGSAPNRIFNIEWRAQYFPGSGTANFELRLYEGQRRFDIIYGTLTNGNTSATAGVQKDNTTFTQYFCNGSGSPATGGQRYILSTATPTDDFNHDGKPDYVLYNGGTHQTAVWYMNDNVFLGGALAPTLPAAWNVIDVADFDGDGDLDYGLFNASTHQTAIWYLSGVTFISGAFGPTLPSAWTLVATADFNFDCDPDYVLYNASTRQTAIWYMNGNVFLGGVFGPTLPAAWRLVGVADFNGDGKTDYLLFNASTRQSAIWYLSGVTFVSGAFGPTIASGYELKGTADFNGDGKPDYLLYNPSTRQTAIWYMNNNVFAGGAFGPTLPGSWNLVAP